MANTGGAGGIDLTMFTPQMLRQLSDSEVEEYLSYYQGELELTERRLSRLEQRRARDPGWASYDQMIGEEVGIDIRIEEQMAVRDGLEIYIQVFIDFQWQRKGLNQTVRML